VTQALLSQQFDPKRQVQKHVLALPVITTASGLRCCSEGAVSCPQSYVFCTLLSRQSPSRCTQDIQPRAVLAKQRTGHYPSESGCGLCGPEVVKPSRRNLPSAASRPIPLCEHELYFVSQMFQDDWQPRETAVDRAEGTVNNVGLKIYAGEEPERKR